MPNTETKQAKHTIKLLLQAYAAELETVANYLAMSVNLDGVRAEEVKNALAGDITEELGHAQRLAHRIKQLGGGVPGFTGLKATGGELETQSDSTDVEAAIRRVIDDEKTAIALYRKIIEDTDGEDFVTQDLATQLLADEEEHRTQFESFLKEYTAA
ncbi:MAG: ferritin-like domain-containing protein [Pirellulaceae bacterium]